MGFMLGAVDKYIYIACVKTNLSSPTPVQGGKGGEGKIIYLNDI